MKEKWRRNEMEQRESERNEGERNGAKGE